MCDCSEDDKLHKANVSAHEVVKAATSLIEVWSAVSRSRFANEQKIQALAPWMHPLADRIREYDEVIREAQELQDA